MAITYEEARRLSVGATLYHTVRRNVDGTARTCTVTGLGFRPVSDLDRKAWFEIVVTLTNGARAYISETRGQGWGVTSPAGVPYLATGKTEMALWRLDALRATRGSRFGCILHAVWRLPMPADGPEFDTSASVTSDGMVMCNYRGADGRYHSGAFVGTHRELVANVKGLAKHLGLSSADAEQFRSDVDEWITDDYRITARG